MHWLPEPPADSAICLGFDGSDVDDWTALRAETREGLQFTPRYGPDRRPTIWNPAEWDGKVPRSEVDVAIDEIFGRFEVARLYADPPRWETDIEAWAMRHGEERIISWPTYRTAAMHMALERFVADLTEKRITHDGCPLTAINLANARKVAKTSERYLLGKASQTQKIDAAMATVLAHEAAADARAANWAEPAGPTYFRLPR